MFILNLIFHCWCYARRTICVLTCQQGNATSWPSQAVMTVVHSRSKLHVTLSCERLWNAHCRNIQLMFDSNELLLGVCGEFACRLRGFAPKQHFSQLEFLASYDVAHYESWCLYCVKRIRETSSSRYHRQITWEGMSCGFFAAGLKQLCAASQRPSKLPKQKSSRKYGEIEVELDRWVS
jgi:hypothetical protein